KKSLKSTQKSSSKKKVTPIPYSPTQEILDGDLIGKAIIECLGNNDPEGVIEMISIYLETLNQVKTLSKTHKTQNIVSSSLRTKDLTIKNLAKIVSTTVQAARK
ncbi:MAG TPA: hypothetical protein VLH77_01545, partial [Gammaproteobacteria bacterium]|nr:hypothetical protein [Gammaproteobacteria bacterium]